MFSLFSLPSLVLGCILAFILRGKWREWQISRRCGKYKQIPRVAGELPFFGHALDYGKDAGGFMWKNAEKYGVPFSFSLLGKDYIIVDDDFAKSFFRSPEDDLSFRNANLQQLLPELTFGVETVMNDWHAPLLRTYLRNSNLGPMIAPLGKQMRVTLEEFGLESLKPGQSKDFQGVKDFAFKTVARFSASSFLGEESANRPEVLDVFINYHLECFRLFQLKTFVPRNLLFLFARSLQKETDIISEIIIKETKKRKEQLARGEEIVQDVLTAFMNQRDGEGKEYTPEFLGQRTMALVFASMATTAGVLTDVLNELGGRQQFWPKLLEEQKEAWKKNNGVFDKNILDSLPFLDAFVEETMRMACGAGQQLRLAMKDVVLDDYFIPKDSFVMVSGVLSMYNPKSHVNPETFDPYRFYQVEDLPSTYSFPFGIGRRLCSGKHFAWAEIKTCVALLMREFHFKTKDGKVAPYNATPLGCSRPAVPFIFTKRNTVLDQE